jgi:hypothetical protein
LRDLSYINAKLKRAIFCVSSLGLFRAGPGRRGRPNTDFEEDGMRVVTGGDWSTGLSLDSGSDSTLLKVRLGEGLREVFSDMVEQPLPPEFDRLATQIGGAPRSVGGAARNDGLRKATE